MGSTNSSPSSTKDRKKVTDEITVTKKTMMDLIVLMNPVFTITLTMGGHTNKNKKQDDSTRNSGTMGSTTAPQ